MRVYLLKDVPKIGFAGEIIKVSEGYARNFLFPKKFAVLLTEENESFYQTKLKTVVQRKEALASETSMRAEKINNKVITIKRKVHDKERLYNSINPQEIADALALVENVKITKSQVEIPKAIKELGSYPVTIKLSSRLKPTITVKIVAEE
jgi:large subunit ribosomal protein L9